VIILAFTTSFCSKCSHRSECRGASYEFSTDICPLPPHEPNPCDKKYAQEGENMLEEPKAKDTAVSRPDNDIVQDPRATMRTVRNPDNTTPAINPEVEFINRTLP